MYVGRVLGTSSMVGRSFAKEKERPPSLSPPQTRISFRPSLICQPKHKGRKEGGGGGRVSDLSPSV